MPNALTVTMALTPPSPPPSYSLSLCTSSFTCVIVKRTINALLVSYLCAVSQGHGIFKGMLHPELQGARSSSSRDISVNLPPNPPPMTKFSLGSSLQQQPQQLRCSRCFQHKVIFCIGSTPKGNVLEPKNSPR